MEMKAWLARDKNGKIFLYDQKPIKTMGIWVYQWGVCFLPIEEKDLPKGVNPRWEDEEPQEVRLKIEKI